MAKFLGVNVLVSLVLSAPFITGCDGRQEQPIKINAGIAQGSCSFGMVYKNHSEGCKFIPMLTGTVQTEPNVDIKIVSIKKDISVVEMVTIKKNDGCISVTKNTDKPLSLQECILYAQSTGRQVLWFSSIDGKVTIQIPFQVGEQLALVKKDTGELYWVFPK